MPGRRSGRRPSRPPKLTPEEIQQQLNEAFGPWEWMKSHPSPGLSARRRRSLFRVSKPATGGPSRRQRCDARVKNLFRIGKNGVRVTRGLFCKGWAMENGRCWVHGGASTGPRTPEGKARVVAAMVEGRRKWVERRRAEGRKFPAGRKRGERWVTEPMRERARAEAHRLKGGRFTLDRAADPRPAQERQRLPGKHGKSEGDARRPRACGVGAGSSGGARAHRRIALSLPANP